MTLWGASREKNRQRDRGSDIWLRLLTVGLASLKINKFFDDKDPTDSLIPSLSHSLFSTALLSFPLSPSLCPFFTLAVLMGWGWRVSVVCMWGGRGGINRHPAALVVPSAAGFFFHPVCSPLYASHLLLPFTIAKEVKPLSPQSRFSAWRIRAEQGFNFVGVSYNTVWSWLCKIICWKSSQL